MPLEVGTAAPDLPLLNPNPEPVSLAGEERTFLRDGDTVTIEATAPGVDGSPITLAEVTGTVRSR